MEKKINQVAFVNAFLECAFSTYAIVYVLKYINEMLTIQQLSTSLIIGTLMAAVTLQVAKNEVVTNFLKKYQVTIVILNDLIWIGVAILLFIDPFAYVIANGVVIKGITITAAAIANRYLANATFQGDAKAKYENLMQQATLIGNALGSGMCIIFSDLHVFTAVWILIGSTVVLTPLNIYLITLMRRYIRNR